MKLWVGGCLFMPKWYFFFFYWCFVSVAVQALEVMYNALNSPTQLTGWRIGGGDPCGESWKGVTCEGSAVVSMYEIHVILHIFYLFFLKCVYYCQGFISNGFCFNPWHCRKLLTNMLETLILWPKSRLLTHFFFKACFWSRKLIDLPFVMLVSELSGLGLDGTLGYLLSDLMSLRKLWDHFTLFFLLF